LNNARSIESQIEAAEKELANLNRRKTQLENEIKHLRNNQHAIAEKTLKGGSCSYFSSTALALTRSLTFQLEHSDLKVWFRLTPSQRSRANQSSRNGLVDVKL